MNHRSVRSAKTLRRWLYFDTFLLALNIFAIVINVLVGSYIYLLNVAAFALYTCFVMIPHIEDYRDAMYWEKWYADSTGIDGSSK